MSNSEQFVELYCNNCAKETKHRLLANVKQAGDSSEVEEYGVFWDYFYQIFQCRGCEYATYRTRFYFSEYQHDGMPPIYEDTYYPPRRTHQKPQWYNQLSEGLQRVLDEVYGALYGNLKYLTAVGARTALDMMIVEVIGDIGNFQEKIDALENGGFITAQERELIETVTEAGNAAAHRGYVPEKDDLLSTIEILESLLHKFFVREQDLKRLLEAAKNIKAVVPPRSKRSSKSVRQSDNDV